MNLQDQEELIKAEKEINKEYLSEIKKNLLNFPCFSGKNLYIGVKLWNDLLTEFSNKPKDVIFDELIKVLRKCFKYLVDSENAFMAYRYILKAVRVELSKKKENIDEGETF